MKGIDIGSEKIKEMSTEDRWWSIMGKMGQRSLRMPPNEFESLTWGWPRGYHNWLSHHILLVFEVNEETHTPLAIHWCSVMIQYDLME